VDKFPAWRDTQSKVLVAPWLSVKILNIIDFYSRRNKVWGDIFQDSFSGTIPCIEETAGMGHRNVRNQQNLTAAATGAKRLNTSGCVPSRRRRL